MNICIDLEKFLINYISFLETKQNIIMDGNFTKILYSNQYFTMNGLFIYIPIEIISIEKVLNKNFLKFNPFLEKNSAIIKELSNIEIRLLEYYKHYFHSKCKIVNLLSKQLYSGNIKVLCEKFNDNKSSRESMDSLIGRMDNIVNNTSSGNKEHYVLKISGIWETYEDIGLTYKLIKVSMQTLTEKSLLG